MASGSNYQIQRFLGSGHFGDVYLAHKGGKCFAIKKVVNTDMNTAEQEIKILKQVDHEKIIKYIDHFMENNILCIVLEYADVGTMEKAVRTQNHQEWAVWRVIAHLSGALDYLHSRRPQITHRNIKPDNILGVTAWCNAENGNRVFWKLGDFGVTRMLTREAEEAFYGGEAPGVPTYMGPEVLRDFEAYTASSDIWSLGCVIAFYIRKGKHVFNCKDDVLYYRPTMASDMILNVESTDNYSSSLIQLVCFMIEVLPVNQYFWLTSVSPIPLFLISSQTMPGRRPTANPIFNMCTSKRCESGAHRSMIGLDKQNVFPAQ